uniref:Uncharacterized protein n=1 Tax=Anopheles albimanus TaxID=7167 RepID=A0A182FER7_ANOAL
MAWPPGSAMIFTKEPTVRIQCLSGAMLITIKDAPANLNGQFSGMVYPKGLAKNSTCLTEYHEQEGPLRYKLPLKSCDTMPVEMARPAVSNLSLEQDLSNSSTETRYVALWD